MVERDERLRVKVRGFDSWLGCPLRAKALLPNFPHCNKCSGDDALANSGA